MKIGRVLQESRVERGVSLCFPAITRICIATCCSRFLMKRERERESRVDCYMEAHLVKTSFDFCSDKSSKESNSVCIKFEIDRRRKKF